MWAEGPGGAHLRSVSYGYCTVCFRIWEDHYCTISWNVGTWRSAWICNSILGGVDNCGNGLLLEVLGICERMLSYIAKDSQ